MNNLFELLPNNFIIFDTEFTSWLGSQKEIGQVQMKKKN